MKKRLFIALLCVLVFVVAGVSLLYEVNVQAQRASQSDRNANLNADDPEALHTVPFSSTGSCGVERWSVKTGTDADVGLINLQSVTQTTVATLGALPAPSNPPANNRVQPTETTVFQLHDTLTQFKLEADSDYHLILDDGAGHTMIAEIPDPVCVGTSSPLLTDIRTARSEFDAKFTPNGNFQTANVPVTVTGVGFFDFLHGQSGVAPNGIELHAVLDVQFGTGGTPTPTPTATSTPTATPTPAPTSTPTATPTPNPNPTPTPTPPPTGGTNLIQNGGFETSGSWSFSGASLPVITKTNPHTGSSSLQVGTTSGQQGDSIASQAVSIPSSTTTATLSFFYWPTTNDSISFAWQEVDVLNSSGQVLQQVFRKLTNDRAWIQVSVDVSKDAGQTVSIRFLDHEQSNGGTFFAYMFVDDVAVTVQSPPPTGGTNLIQNGGFETSGSWSFSGTSLPVITKTNPHTGSSSLQVGTTGGQQGDSIASQTISIPASTTKATLSFFYWPTTNDSSTFAWQEVDILNSSGQVAQQVFRKLTNDRAWIQVSVDLSKFAGQTISIQFLDHEQSNGGTFFAYMFVDDVAVTVQ